MIRIEKETRLTTGDVLTRARAFFGEAGLGLEEGLANPCCASFEGGGGHVLVSVVEESERRAVIVEAREWEHQARQFLKRL
jgi:hypothetical protein